MSKTSIELFAGAGGLALGLEQAGFEHLGLIEIDSNAAKTLKINRPKWNVICDDIEKIAKQDLEYIFNVKKGALDLLSGGAPCQSFSYAGKRLGLEDTRGTMFYHYATFLNKLQPKVFLFENVKGLKSHDKGRTFKTILNIFEDEGYNINYEVLNAWDYGVAQKRERLIVVGIRNDLKNNFIFPEKKSYKPVLRDVLKNVPESDMSFYSPAKKEVFSLVPPGGYWRDIDSDIAKDYMKTCWYMGGGRTGILRRMSYDEPSLTILTTPQMKQTDRCHPEEVRPFSVRESARIQSFPDSWEFVGSTASKYKQIGNAVPCNLAKEVGLSIIKILEEKHLSDYNLSFISQKDFEEHVSCTLKEYSNTLKSIDLKKFNKNIIDPVKLTFDKNVWAKSYEEIIEFEISRQRDKTNSNSIGYFHQNIFKYIERCVVPKSGWDIIFSGENNYYVELKNKHNTMNSSSSQKTFMRMQNHLLTSEDKDKSICALVEVISKKSDNKPWSITLDKIKQPENENIRRISIDKFYEIVTGQKDAFYQLCKQLPKTIEKLVSQNSEFKIEEDTVFEELNEISSDMETALYLLAFSTYEGFSY